MHWIELDWEERWYIGSRVGHGEKVGMYIDAVLLQSVP